MHLLWLRRERTPGVERCQDGSGAGLGCLVMHSVVIRHDSDRHDGRGDEDWLELHDFSLRLSRVKSRVIATDTEAQASCRRFGRSRSRGRGSRGDDGRRGSSRIRAGARAVVWE